MVTPDKKIYDSFLINNDYIGLANYLSQFNPTDETKRKSLQQNINTLKRYGGIANAILEKQQNEEDKLAISFNMQRQYGIYDDKNNYTKQYLNAINSIGNKSHWFKEDEIAEYFDYVFTNKTAYDKFIEDSGLNIQKYDAKHPTETSSFTINGQPAIRVYRKAFKDSNFFDALNKGLDKSIIIDYEASLGDFDNKYAKNRPTIVYNFTTKSYDKNGKELNSVIGFDSNQRKAWQYANKSNEIYKKNIDKAYEKVVPTKLMVSGFLCEAQRNLYTMAMNHQIDSSTYNMQSQIIKDYYNSELANISFTGQDEVYITDPSNDSQTLDLMDENSKGTWTRILRTALKEGRVEYGAGSAGGRVGTVITISDKLDKDDNASTGDYGKGVQIFVPGLFDDDARELIDSDPDARIQVELAEHQAFGHNYDLIEGGTLSNFDGEGGATYIDDLGSYRLTPEQVQQQMKRNILIQGCIDEAKQVLNKNKITILDNNLQSASQDLLTKIKNYAINVYSIDSNAQTQEDLETEEAKQEIDNIYIFILKELGLDRLGNPITN